MQKYALINKQIGETPLQALDRFRAERAADAADCREAGKCDETAYEMVYWREVPMTYAGRLDPMAEGVLLVLIGDECKKKDEYIGLDKEYEVEVLLGVETDTYDTLGLPKTCGQISNFQYPISNEEVRSVLKKYVGKFEQEYPAYSSKTVNGEQLHTLARKNELPDDMPTKLVEIYSIEYLGERSIEPDSLLADISERVSKVQGDFRQNMIMEAWANLLTKSKCRLSIIKIRVNCSSGAYMRSLAHRIGKDLGVTACALSIKRTRIIGIE